MAVRTIEITLGVKLCSCGNSESSQIFLEQNMQSLLQIIHRNFWMTGLFMALQTILIHACAIGNDLVWFDLKGS